MSERSVGYLAIQLIQIRYTDDQRGHEHAEKRERLRALPLPALAGDGVFHDCRVDVWQGFEPRTQSSGIPWRGDHVVIEGLTLRPDESGLVFSVDPRADVRNSKTLCTVAESHWARVVWNAKSGNQETKWLTEFVVNAGLFAGPPASQVFLGAPSSQHDLRQDFLRNAYR